MYKLDDSSHYPYRFRVIAGFVGTTTTMANPVGDTATSAGLNWLNDNCIGLSDEMNATAGFPESDFQTQGNELSVTMTEKQLFHYRSSGSSNSQQPNTQDKSLKRFEASFTQSDVSPSPLRTARPSISPPPSLPRISRKMGPNESLYRQSYQEKVSEQIKAFQSKHNIPDYRSMSKDQQAVEQQRVLNLLGRLRLNAHDLERPATIPDSPDLTHVSRRSDCLPSSDEESTSSDETVDDRVAVDQSMLLLSPTPRTSDHPKDDSDVSSIENVRGSQYESPADRFDKKRLASSSGKRGADTSRMRLESDSHLAHSINRLSLGDDHIFTSSQSPIAPMTSSPIRSSSDEEDIPDPMDTQPDVSFGSHSIEPKKHGNDSLVETAMLPDKKVRWDFDGLYEKEAPTDVRLRQGAAFHLSTVPTDARSFPDPFRFYPDPLQKRLHRLCKWLGNHSAKALVLSVYMQHLIDITMKQLSNQDTRNASGDYKDGNVLVVAREKQDLEVWSQTFREGSGLSVLNHAIMPMKERKSLTGSITASHYDLVLTTYDALKSPDVVIALDEDNHAKIPAQEAIGNWCNASQAQEGAVNKKLSFLHRLKWRKIIFTDFVGKKSYLAKIGTARQQAALAVISDSR